MTADAARLLGLLLPVALAAGGCGPSPVASSAPASASPAGATPSATDLSTANLPPATATLTLRSASPTVRVEAGLLGVLPPRIDGVALEPDPTTAADIAGDPSLAGSAGGIAVALAIRPGTSAGDDLAIASVIRLRPGVFSDAWFATWRSTYDEGACAVAGGIGAAPSQVTIAGRAVYVGTCAGDAMTYHVHLADPTLVVSVTAAGPGRFGELVMAGLTE